jgi:hypothetical protein
MIRFTGLILLAIGISLGNEKPFSTETMVMGLLFTFGGALLASLDDFLKKDNY